MTYPTSTVAILVNGVDVDLSTYGVIDLRVRSSLAETASATVRFADGGVLDSDFAVIDDDRFDVGGTLVVKLVAGSSETTVFDGEIVALGTEATGTFHVGEGFVTVVEAMDRSHRLSARVKPTTYLNQTSSEIVSAIAGEFGLEAEVTATELQHEYVLKTTNDRAFITDLADRIGYEWYVEARKLVFRPRPEFSAAVVDLAYGRDLISFGARASAVDGAQTINVRGWDDAQSVEIVGTASASSADNTAIGSGSPLGLTTYQKGAETFGATMVLVPGVVLDQNEANQRAEAIAGDLQSSTVQLTGSCEGTPLIKPGVWITISDVGRKLSGSYYITDVEHRIGAGSLVTRFRSAGRRPTGLSALGAGSGRPPFGEIGLVIGMVTNINDDKTMYRVKVRFPTLPDLESAWARVVTLGGSAASGMEARPEIDDEVLVGFEQGDPRRPFVIGGLLSKSDTYRTGALNSDGSINKRGIRTRGGNKLELFDGDSKSASSGRYIALIGADAATEIRLGDENMSMKTKSGNPITIESGTAKITLDNGKVTITGDSIEIKATQGAKVEGMTVDLKGSQAVGIDGGTSFKAQGVQVSVNGSGMTEIKGALLKLN